MIHCMTELVQKLYAKMLSGPVQSRKSALYSGVCFNEDKVRNNFRFKYSFTEVNFKNRLRFWHPSQLCFEASVQLFFLGPLVEQCAKTLHGSVQRFTRLAPHTHKDKHI